MPALWGGDIISSEMKTLKHVSEWTTAIIIIVVVVGFVSTYKDDQQTLQCSKF